MTKFIGDGLVEAIQTLQIIPYYMRLDVLPFVLIYMALFTLNHTTTDPRYRLAFLVAIPCVLLLHLLLFLFVQGSVFVRAYVGYYKSDQVHKSSHVLVSAAKNAGEDRIVSIHHADLKKPLDAFTVGSFQFQQSRYASRSVLY
jgi:predicted membrane protein